MKRVRYSPLVFWGVLLLCSGLSAQQAAVSSSTSAAAVVPRLVNFSGKAIDQGKTVTGIAGITFAIYREEAGGSPLWLETQNVQADVKGNYTAQLGATTAEGLPQELFTSGEARWLGVRINGGEEQPRVLLVSVPYALKAADAQTLGGLPASCVHAGCTGSGGEQLFVYGIRAGRHLDRGRVRHWHRRFSAPVDEQFGRAGQLGAVPVGHGSDR